MNVHPALERIDRFQQSRRGLRFCVAVLRKFSDDQAGQLAALIAYYAFVSIFPLLLVLVTILGFILQGNPEAQHEVLESTLGQFPILSNQLRLHSLSGSDFALVVGIVGSLMAGMGVTSAAQNAFNAIWGVPMKRRPNFIWTRLRGLGMLAVLGTLQIISTFVAGFVGTSGHGPAAVVGGVLLAFVVNLILFATAFHLLTAENISWRDQLPGVITAAVFWQLLQHLGGFYLAHELEHTEALYGFFALVLGLLAWLYLGAQLVILAVEVNVVKLRRLWPRAFFPPPLLEADRRALTSLAEVQERQHEQQIEVSFQEKTGATEEAGRNP